MLPPTETQPQQNLAHYMLCAHPFVSLIFYTTIPRGPSSLIIVPYTIQRFFCVMNGHVVYKGPYGLLRLHGHLGLTYNSVVLFEGTLV
jgi:biotin transporter BioY